MIAASLDLSVEQASVQMSANDPKSSGRHISSTATHVFPIFQNGEIILNLHLICTLQNELLILYPCSL